MAGKIKQKMEPIRIIFKLLYCHAGKKNGEHLKKKPFPTDVRSF
jgi:hypothetical protein